MLKLALAMGLVAIGYWWHHRQSILKGFGFTFHWEMFNDLGAGLLISLIAMIGIFLGELLLGSIQILGLPMRLDTLGGHIAMLAFGAVFEEFIFRSLILSGLVVLFFGRKWPAILLTAVLFGLVHFNNSNATYVSTFGNALGGIMYGIAFVGGRNIWLPIGLHFNWNFIQGPVLGFPVSGTVKDVFITQNAIGPEWLTGGAYGPEAGLVGMSFRFLVIALVLYYLQLRSGGQGNLHTLDFPIRIYDNPPRQRKPTA
jgi:membrane protease YdiL (CAAX protease family)